MTEQSSGSADPGSGGAQGEPDPALTGAGLSATGTTADQMSAGTRAPGTTYGDPGGTGTADSESTEGDPTADLAQDSSGNAERGTDS